MQTSRLSKQASSATINQFIAERNIPACSFCFLKHTLKAFPEMTLIQHPQLDDQGYMARTFYL
jgi:hypothetical protein